MAFLELRDVSVSFSGFLAVDKVSLTVAEGETRVIIGPNGAGKTTVIDMITGKTAPTSGKILLAGENISGRSPHEIAGKFKVGRKFQGPNLFDYLTVYDETVDDSRNLEIFDPDATWKRKEVYHFEARELLVPIYQKGKLVYKRPGIEEIKKYCAEQVDTLWDEVKRFDNPHNYYVDLSQKLYDIKAELLNEKNERYEKN